MNTKQAPQTPSEIWADMAGKAHLYKTARHIATDRFVAIHVLIPGTFEVIEPADLRGHYGCHELDEYCL